MNCTHCGNQLPEGTRFCVFCGTAQGSIPVSAPAPVVEASQPPVHPSLAEDSFINAVSVEEATYETPFIATPDYTPPKRTPAPKKKKTGLIIAIVLVLVLALAVGGVFFALEYMKSKAYANATAMMEAGDITGALTAFEDLGDYEDSAKMVKNLKKYQQAMTNLDAHAYDEAREIFKDLGKFHDSKTYVESGVDYHMANYLMKCAEKADPAGLALIPDSDSASEISDDQQLSYELYSAAAEIFENLGDYEDSANLASKCWYGIALIELDRGDKDKAEGMMDKLNDEDAARLQTAIEDSSADTTVLDDLQEALNIWMDKGEKFTEEEQIRNAYNFLKQYEDRYFLDPDLEALYGEFMDALEDQLDAIQSGNDIKDWTALFKGKIDLCNVCKQLYEKYGFHLEEDFLNYDDALSKYPVIEASLKEQLYNIDAPWDDAKGYYYAPYTNDTGYDFKLSVTIEFYKGNTKKDTSKEMSFTVKSGDTITIPLVPQTQDVSEFNGWKAVWTFEPS